MASEFRPASNKADSTGNQRDSHPARNRDMLVQGEPRNQSQQDVSQGTCRQQVGKISPGKGRNKEGEKNEKKQNPRRSPGIGESQQKTGEVLQSPVSSLLHSVRKQGIPHRRK